MSSFNVEYRNNTFLPSNSFRNVTPSIKYFFVSFLLVTFLRICESKCRMEQKCDVHKPDCRPIPSNDTEPEILRGPNVICPEYFNQTACCNDGQNILLKTNFDALDGVFGSSYGGCDVCAINLKRFWCHFTCSPDQDKFMNITGFQDFVIDNKNYTLLMINMTLNSDMNCALFDSCKKTKYASQVVAMSNAIGFMTFQGTEAYRKAPIFITLDFEKETGLNFTVDSCNTTAVNDTLRGFHVDSDCKCNSCQKSCSYENKTTLPILEGFSLATVGFYYFIVLLFTFVIYICKWMYKKNNPHESSRSSSIYTAFAPDNKNTLSSVDLTGNGINNNNSNKDN